MDNVIQNIKIDDIIPNNNHQYDKKEIGELASSIKQLGLLEPITVRPREDNKYELILGNKRYKASIIAGLKTIPAIVKKIDDNRMKDYITLNNISTNNQFLSNTINNDSDVINLSKLNKEYERDELKMNNNQLNNNNIMQSQNNNQPAFGGRFFPSLEDEPTNMNFGTPNITPQSNNNFIDLTDVNTETPEPLVQKPAINNLPNNQITENIYQSPIPQNNNQPMQTTQTMQTMPAENNIINLENLKLNNELITPQPIIDNNTQVTENELPQNLNQNTTPVSIEQPIITPIIEPQSTPTIESQPIVEQYNNAIPSSPVIDLPQQNVATPNLDSFGQQLIIENPMTNPVIQQEPIISQEPVVLAPTEPEIIEQPAKKEILPVINTIKSTAVNLENFGYTIRITDEDLPNSYKITIEVDK